MRINRGRSKERRKGIRSRVENWNLFHNSWMRQSFSFFKLWHQWNTHQTYVTVWCNETVFGRSSSSFALELVRRQRNHLVQWSLAVLAKRTLHATRYIVDVTRNRFLTHWLDTPLWSSTGVFDIRMMLTAAITANGIKRRNRTMSRISCRKRGMRLCELLPLKTFHALNSYPTIMIIVSLSLSYLVS
jgi:hypothetical protein